MPCSVCQPWTLGYRAVRRHVLGSRSRAHAADAKNFVTVRTACGACALGWARKCAAAAQESEEGGGGGGGRKGSVRHHAFLLVLVIACAAHGDAAAQLKHAVRSQLRSIAPYRICFDGTQAVWMGEAVEAVATIVWL